tara:strand:+ start:1770 stop:1967 length:198 start_codon:yes stop_codon:yes gene_type:complete
LQNEEFYKVKKLVENSSRGMEFHSDSRKKIGNMMLKLNQKTGFKRVIKLLEIIDTLADSDDYHLM